MTETLTVRMPSQLARQLRAKAKAAKSHPSAVLRRLAAEYVRGDKQAVERNKLQEHIAAFAGTWDGQVGGEELLKKTRPYGAG